jgi:Carboxypeptidase regulatory-like domain
MVYARAYELPPGGGGYGPGVGTIVVYTKDSSGYPIAGSYVVVTNLQDVTLAGTTDDSGGIIVPNLPTGSYDCYVIPPPGWLAPPDIFPNAVEGEEPVFVITLTPDVDALLLPPTGLEGVPVFEPLAASAPGGSWLSAIGQFVTDHFTGEVKGVVADASGVVLGPNAAVIGYVANHAGQVKDVIGNVAGDVAGSMASVLLPPPFSFIVGFLTGRAVVDQTGAVIGTLTSNGTVRNVAGAIIGTIVNPAGEIADVVGNIIGHVAPQVGVPSGGGGGGGSGSVTVTVQSKQTGRPIPGAVVSIEAQQQATNAQGVATIGGLVDGPAAFAVRAQGYQPQTGMLTVPAAVTIQLVPVSTSTGTGSTLIFAAGIALAIAGVALASQQAAPAR